MNYEAKKNGNDKRIWKEMNYGEMKRRRAI
jgi:hypothetical protein